MESEVSFALVEFVPVFAVYEHGFRVECWIGEWQDSNLPVFATREEAEEAMAEMLGGDWCASDLRIVEV